MLIRIGEALAIGWSRNMLYSGFNTLHRSVVRRQTGFAARTTRTLYSSNIFRKSLVTARYLSKSLTSILTIFVLANCCQAQDPPDDLKALKSEIKKLKKEVEELKEQLEVAEHNGFFWAGEKALGSPLYLLKKLPKELALKPKQYWGKFEISDVTAQLQQQNGSQFAAKLKANIRIKESDQRGVFDVSVSLQPNEFSYKGYRFNTQFLHRVFQYGRFTNQRTFEFKSDQNTIDSLKKVNTKKPIPISAQIDDITLSKKTVSISFKSLIIDGIKLN